MTKQEIIDQIQQMDSSQTIKNSLLARVELYPDELLEAHMNDFENLVREVATKTDSEIAALSKAAINLQNGLDKEEIDFTSQMNDLAQEAEATNNQFASMNS